MIITNKHKLAAIFLSYFIMSVALAKEVKFFTENNVPSAEEMADILLGTNEVNVTRAKTRSLSFGRAEKHSPIHIGLPIKFERNSSSLSDNSIKYLKQLGLMLKLGKMSNKKIMLVGHTDAEGTEDYNQYLSEMRSSAVKKHLVSNYQVNTDVILTSGKGEAEILTGVPGNASMNRRVEIHLIR